MVSGKCRDIRISHFLKSVGALFNPAGVRGSPETLIPKLNFHRSKAVFGKVIKNPLWDNFWRLQ